MRLASRRGPAIYISRPAAFALTASGGDVTVSPGRYYAGGVLCECA